MPAQRDHVQREAEGRPASRQVHGHRQSEEHQDVCALLLRLQGAVRPGLHAGGQVLPGQVLLRGPLQSPPLPCCGLLVQAEDGVCRAVALREGQEAA